MLTPGEKKKKKLLPFPTRCAFIFHGVVLFSPSTETRERAEV